MSSEKSDEFSLEGLEDLDLSENPEEVEATPVEEEGFELDLSGDESEFSLADEEAEVSNAQVQDPNEFSLTDHAVDFSLSEDGEVENQEVFPADEFDLGDEAKEEFHLGEEDLGAVIEEAPLAEDFTDSSESVDESDDLFSLDDSLSDDESLEDFSLGEELSEDASLEDFSLSDDSEPDQSLEDEDLFAVGSSEDDESNAFTDPLKDYSSPKIQLDPEDLTEDVKAKLKEIDAIMEEDATIAAINVHKTSEEVEDHPTDDGLNIDSLDLNEAVEEESSLDLTAPEEFEGIEEEVVPPSEDMFATEEAPPLEEELIVAEEHIEDESLVGDLNLSDLDLGESEIEEEAPAPEPVVAPKKRKKKEAQVVAESSSSLDEISQAYTGEMERTQATIANLRADRDELLKRIDLLEEEKLLSQRNNLSLRAELDEKKIELTIIRKKLNEEINELKDKIRIYEEKVLILEEKNKQLHQEIDSVGQKNKIDIKRVMLRERELEQKLELLKADAETQIRNRDLKILELKRKIDAMEFDMESISQQEKKTLESRFELEDKLDKAIRTLRTAISTLEEDGNRSSTLEAIKKNIEM